MSSGLYIEVVSSITKVLGVDPVTIQNENDHGIRRVGKCRGSGLVAQPYVWRMHEDCTTSPCQIISFRILNVPGVHISIEF